VGAETVGYPRGSIHKLRLCMREGGTRIAVFRPPNLMTKIAL